MGKVRFHVFINEFFRRLIFCLICIGVEVCGQLITKSTCTCVGYDVTFECSVMHRSSTVWNGTAFHCASSGNAIILLHSRFNDEDDGARGTCNNGAIKGRSLRTAGSTYTSQLVVSVSSEMIGESIVCTADNGLHATPVGRVTLATTTGQLN